MTEHTLDVGDIIIGKALWNMNRKGEVVKIIEGVSPESVLVRYESGAEMGHLRRGSTEVKWVGKKIPVINIEDLI